jgi:hypothetical protein
MDKIKTLVNNKLDIELKNYKNRLLSYSSWQIDSFIPYELKQKSQEEKISFLMEQYENNNPIFFLLNAFLKKNNGSQKIDLKDFELLEIDARFLESRGLKDEQIKDYYEFVKKLKSLI